MPSFIIQFSSYNYDLQLYDIHFTIIGFFFYSQFHNLHFILQFSFTITTQVTEYHEMESLSPKLIHPRTCDYHPSSKVHHNLLEDEEEETNTIHLPWQGDFWNSISILAKKTTKSAFYLLLFHSTHLLLRLLNQLKLSTLF